MRLWHATAILSLAITPLWAQETASEEEAAPAVEETAPAPADAEAETPAEPAPAPQPEAPAPDFVVSTHTDWELRCSADETTCFLYQLALNSAGAPVAEFSLLKLPEGQKAEAGVTVVTPLGTLLTAGLRMRIDSGQTLAYPFNWCTRAGCFARFGLEAGTIASMKAGAKSTMTLISISQPDVEIPVEISLSGFTAAYTALQARN